MLQFILFWENMHTAERCIYFVVDFTKCWRNQKQIIRQPNPSPIPIEKAKTRRIYYENNFIRTRLRSAEI